MIFIYILFIILILLVIFKIKLPKPTKKGSDFLIQERRKRNKQKYRKNNPHKATDYSGTCGPYSSCSNSHCSPGSSGGGGSGSSF